ncbi:efflux RND transporter periplasmic adaptor subunit [Acidovorax sp. NCPPB 2350]|nr:efflux RND transporter periplasmic adaptor subunit [Acidovorax sp. NCPPB 2350]
MKQDFFESRSVRLIAIAASLAALSACTRTPADTVAETVRPAYVVPARDSAAAALEYVGEVRSTQRIELAFPVSGLVGQVLVEPGDTVRRGQILALLDDKPLQAQFAAAGGDVARLEAQAAEARLRVERARAARAAGATSESEWSAVQAEQATADAALRSARAQRDLAAWSLEHARLRAPAAGVVATRTLEPGQTAGPGVPVMAIDGSGRELSIRVPGHLGLQAGQPAVLRSGAERLESRVLRVSGRLETGGVRQVFLSVPDTAPVGSTWSVAVASGAAAQAGVQVPLRALLPGQTGDAGSVLRLKADGQTTELAAVRLGAVQGDWIEVSDGLRSGDRVVVAGGASIAPGARVSPVAAQQ